MESASTSTAASTASVRLAFRRSRRLRWVLAGITALVVGFAVFAAVLLWPAGTPRRDPYDAAAIAYASTQIVWNSPPAVQATQVVPLNRLAAALCRFARPNVARDVAPAVPGLIRRFGASHRVVLVLLTGSYNSLPPDEGIVSNGQLAVLVDSANEKGFYVNY